MSNKNREYLIKLQSYKKWTEPIIYVLDKLRVLPIFIPFINLTLRKAGFKKNFQIDLNYRIFGKIFKDSFRDKGKNEKDKLILIPFLKSGNSVFFLINMMLSKWFLKKGYRPLFFLCDKALPICSKERIYKTREEDKMLCLTCHGTYPFLEKITGAEILYVSSYLNEENYQKEANHIDLFQSLNECKSYTFNGLEIGVYVEKSVLKFFLTGKLSESCQEHLIIYKKFLKAVTLYADSWGNFIEQLKIKPSFILINNGSLSFETVIRKYCEREGINYVTHETYIGKNSWIYKKNDEVMKLKWDDQWEEFKKIKLTSDRKIKAKNFIEGLRSGKEMYAKLNETLPLDDKLKNEKYVTLFTNLNFDTAVLGRNPVFDSMEDWIYSVIDYWIENKIKTKLVIRIHPGELKLITASRDFIGQKISEYIKGHENIILFDAYDAVDSYSLIESMEFGLIYSSTIGLEISYMKKPCLVAGSAFFSEQKFVKNPLSITDYFNDLKSFLNHDFNINLNEIEILKFVYFIYFDRVKRLNGLSIKPSELLNDLIEIDSEKLIELNSKILEDFTKEIVLNN